MVPPLGIAKKIIRLIPRLEVNLCTTHLQATVSYPCFYTSLSSLVGRVYMIMI